MRALPLLVVATFASWTEPSGASSIAREPILRALRQATPAVRDCSARYVLSGGRYQVKLTLLAGRAREVTVVGGPGLLSEPARDCLARAFAAPAYPELSSLQDGTPEEYRITYPFVLVEPDALSPPRPRPARVKSLRGR
ncbi:MAG: hypothetical protein HS104_23865 [Polyangiaceae bacterium]|nr:hypothetical protein [Polyangiaceae bacterium]MCL4751922.1 hypothetical protein [Myxococcales bacterium]